MNKTTWLNKLDLYLPKIQIALTVAGILFSLIIGIKRGLQSETVAETIVWIFAGFIGALLMVAVHAGLRLWDLTSDNLSAYFIRHPGSRRAILFLLVISVFIITVGIVWYTNFDIFLKTIIAILYALILPSAVLSLVQEERRRENLHLLGKHVSPELIAENPQAAIEHSFTVFEEHLRRRINASPNDYGEVLINKAYAQKGKLRYSVVENENKGIRNLISGVYATLRNPRKHRLVEDDKYTALVIISLVDLLMQLINDSTDKDDNAADQA